MKPPLDPSLFDLAGVLWVMHCAEGPVPRTSVDAARAYLDKELRPWELSYEAWQRGADEVRAEAAALVGGAPEDITLTTSTSAGLSAIARGLAFSPGDEVLVPLGEFPSNVWPWKALSSREVRFREAPLWEGHRAGREAWEGAAPQPGVDPEASLARALGPRTRVLAVSWVRFQDGLVLDLARLARACMSAGVHLVVDGIQGAGTLPVGLEGVSAFATGAQKGLLSPQGAGFLWTRSSLRAELAPLGSWLSVEEGSDFRRPSTDHERRWLADGRKLETGGFAGLSFTPLTASLRLLGGAGIPAIRAHVHELQARLLARLESHPSWDREVERLRGLHAEGRVGSFLALHHGGRGHAWLSSLVQDGLRRRIYATAREGYLRIALHGWHTEEDVQRLADWLATAAHQ